MVFDKISSDGNAANFSIDDLGHRISPAFAERFIEAHERTQQQAEQLDSLRRFISDDHSQRNLLRNRCE